MRTVNLEQRFAAGLLAFGFTEGKRLARFRVFTKPDNPTFYVGKAGSLRLSKSHKVTDSMAVSDKLRDALLSHPAVPTHQHRGFLLRDPPL